MKAGNIEPDIAYAAAIQARHRIVFLVGVHVAIGLVAAFVTAAAFRRSDRSTMFRWLQAVWLGIMFGQTTLLGTWAGLGLSRWWKRLFWVSVGIGCILLLLTLCQDSSFYEIGTVVVLSTALVAMTAIVLRVSGSVIQPGWLDAARARRLQFSVRQLMIVTLLVGCLAAVGRALPSYAIDARWLSGAILWGAVSAWFGLVPVWPALATTHPVRYGIESVVVAATIACCLGRIAANGDEALLTTGIAIEATVVVVSLLVVRSCGYRLTRALPPT